ncbi:MAG: alkaline phosphatase family protein [Candidatus Bipolaricaulota bacterium]
MNTFIFAIDGASPALVNEWMEEGHLPNLKKIKDGGLSGKLESTFPPLTGPAWSSFQTGVNPGKHGVFNWLDLSESYRGKVISSRSIKTNTVWNWLNRHGCKVGLLSLPVTYPPEKIAGFVVPGFMTPSNEKGSGYPDQVTNSLFREIPNFRHHPPFFAPNQEPGDWVDGLNRTIRMRGKAARFLYKKYLSKEEASTFTVHFFSTDHVQHKLWNRKEDDRDPRLEVFKETDRQIGKIMELAPDDTTFLVTSDHGFGSVENVFNVNNWLQEKKLIKFKNNFASVAKKKFAEIGLTQDNLKPLGDRLYPLAEKLNLIDNFTTAPLTDERLSALFLSHKDIEWNNTIAYSRSDVGHVRINRKGREEQGMVEKENYKAVREEILNALREVKLPEGGGKLSRWVQPREKVYSGPFLNQAPDILFDPLPNRVLGYGGVMFMSKNVFSLNPSTDPGHHRRNGILMASGPSVQVGKRNADIVDIAPTLLNLFNYPIPEQMDGEVIREIAPDEPTYHRPADFYKSREVEAELDDSRGKLENLGYL